MSKNDDHRSAIWSIAQDRLSAYFALYTLIYVSGAVTIVILRWQGDVPTEELVSRIMTDIGVWGIGVAPPVSIVLTEIWGYIMLLGRNLAAKVRARELANDAKEAEIRAMEAEIRARETQLLEQAYERGVQDERARAEGKNVDPPPWAREPKRRKWFFR